MSVARISCQQLLEIPLRPAQEAVDVETVSVGGYLRHDPGRKPYERLSECTLHTKDALEDREANLYLLPECGASSLMARSPAAHYALLAPYRVPRCGRRDLQRASSLFRCRAGLRRAVPPPGARPRCWLR